MNSRYEELLRSALRANLEKHATKSTSRAKGDTVSYTDYQTSEQAIMTKFANAPYNLCKDKLERVRQRVQDEVFALSRKTVDERIATLLADPSDGDLSRACHSLAYDLFRPWYQQERYYSADYFASKGGIQLLVDLVGSECTTTNVKLHAMSALWCFCSDERRSRLLMESKILEVIDPLLKKGTDKVRTRCVGLLWGLLEFPDVQKEIVEAGFLTPLSEILKSPSGSIIIIELAMGCLQCCCSNYCLIERLVKENMDDAIINRCVRLLSFIGYVGSDMAGKITMSCYFGYHALASMYLHAETKCWLDEMQVSNHRSQAGQSNLICSFLEKKETALTAIDVWLHNNSYAKIRDIEDGHYVWRYMHPFALLLYGRSPVVRRMGAFSMANLMKVLHLVQRQRDPNTGKRSYEGSTLLYAS
ncbi:uncharacterized protein LOC134186900 isoform X2 [Corticium candelabrum]|uniref:uncharacterized protein LOC134186900 isoform X2 n=1 Tax=Corticium candelabrum TaxID=121492 RepID=UPI002E268ACF|nr:uncharacterized protein LOC134186900 isoform X2 [Corticium candelabrum]